MSTSAPWTLRNECKCGHHHDSHHEGKYTCLASFCDCTRFRKFDEPEERSDKSPDTQPSLALTKPHADTSCTCPACVAWTRTKWNPWGP